MNPEIEIFNVDINEISQTSKENFGESTYRNCYFCEKPFQIDSKDIFSIQNLKKDSFEIIDEFNILTVPSSIYIPPPETVLPSSSVFILFTAFL